MRNSYSLSLSLEGEPPHPSCRKTPAYCPGNRRPRDQPQASSALWWQSRPVRKAALGGTLEGDPDDSGAPSACALLPCALPPICLLATAEGFPVGASGSLFTLQLYRLVVPKRLAQVRRGSV